MPKPAMNKTGYSAGASRKMSKQTQRGIARPKNPPPTNSEIQRRASKTVAKPPKA